MLSQSADGGALPTTLDMIRRSDFSQIAVEYSTQGVLPELIPAALAAGQNLRTEPGLPLVRQGAKTLALVLANKRSKALAAGESGHMLVTDEVVDYTQKDEPHAKKYSITSFCTLETMTDYKLDPPARQKTQAAMISVTDVLTGDADSAEQPVTSLLVDDVQLLTPEEADALLPMFKKWRNEGFEALKIDGQYALCDRDPVIDYVVKYCCKPENQTRGLAHAYTMISFDVLSVVQYASLRDLHSPHNL